MEESAAHGQLGLAPGCGGLRPGRRGHFHRRRWRRGKLRDQLRNHEHTRNDGRFHAVQPRLSGIDRYRLHRDVADGNVALWNRNDREQSLRYLG
jgi:hypothetical protein